MFVKLARASGHAGDAAAEALPLLDVYGKLRTGALSPGTPDGSWAFGLALLRAASSATP
jgi:hypothetical protein